MPCFSCRSFGSCLVVALATIAFFAVGCDTIPTPDPLPPDNVNSNASGNSNSNDNQSDLEEVADPGLDGIELDLLITSSSVKPVIVYDGEVPSHVEVRVPVEKYDPEEPVSAALEFLESYRNFYRLEEPAAQLVPGRLWRDETGEHVFFQQQFNGILVHAGELAVHMKDGMVLGTNGHYLPEIRDFGEPKFDVYRAIDIATRAAGGHPNDLASSVRLMIFNGKLFGHTDTSTRLAWTLAVRPDCDEGSCETFDYFVDAMTGEVIYVESRSIHCDKDFDINTANGTTSSTCWNSPFETADDEMYDEDGRWCGVFEGCANTTPEGFAAFNFSHQVYDYFAGTFGRCGWDGDDAQLEVMINVGFMPANAEYNRGCDYIAFSPGYVQLDAFAHEYTHAITRHSSGLMGSGEPGALNEHYSDVFASMFDNNWQIGEGIPGGTLRDMSNPPAFGDPDHMVKAQCTANIGFVATGDKYANMAIMNKAAFLMTDGGTHKGVTVGGIGRQKVARLFYHVLTGRLTSGSRFGDARNATVSLAREWALGGNAFGFTMGDVCSVINAYAAVGIGAQDLDCDGYDDFEDSDDDQDFIPDSRDNCVRVKNRGQENSDGDVFGDACDDDDDNDGVKDNVDGCPYAANPDQADTDGDGIQSACDNCPNTTVLAPDAFGRLRWFADPDQTDTDHDGRGDICDEDDDNDGVLDAVDNCPRTRNPDQTDLNGDGIGLVCDQVELSALDRDQQKPDLQTPIDPGECIMCGPYVGFDYRSRINVLMSSSVNVRLVDEWGRVVGKVKEAEYGDGSNRFIFDFQPKAGMFYQFPERVTTSRFVQRVPMNAAGQRVIQPTRYFLDAAPVWTEGDYDATPMELNFRTAPAGM